MPCEEQTCSNCAGDCCSFVSFLRSDKAFTPPYDIMSFTVQELKTRGFIEVYNPHAPCTAKSKYGCLIYDQRPRLCQSYFCYGRYWRAASTVNNSSKEAINPVTAKSQHHYPEPSSPQVLQSPHRLMRTRRRCA